MSASLRLVAPQASAVPEFDAGAPGATELLSIEHLHLVSLTTSGRKPVLVGELARELRQMVTELAAQSGYRVVSLAIGPDRIDILTELSGLHRPQSISRELRGMTSLRLMQHFPWLRLRMRSSRLWE
jgi:REP element-mobilizing transposase RayT